MSAERDGWEFSTLQRIRFGDLDAMQHMNNVEFLRFFETARIDYIRTLLPQHRPTATQRFGFIFAECHIAYRTPAHFDEHLRTWMRPADLKRSSVKIEFEMVCEEDGRLVAEGYGVLVGYDYEKGAATPLPEEIRERLEAGVH